MIGITNTGYSFPLAYCYIITESAKSFEFVVHQLTKYVFYDCPEPAVIVADFTKGLGASLTAKAVQDWDGEPAEEGWQRPQSGELPDISEVLVTHDRDDGEAEEPITL